MEACGRGREEGLGLEREERRMMEGKGPVSCGCDHHSSGYIVSLTVKLGSSHVHSYGCRTSCDMKSFTAVFQLTVLAQCDMKSFTAVFQLTVLAQCDMKSFTAVF